MGSNNIVFYNHHLQPCQFKVVCFRKAAFQVVQCISCSLRAFSDLFGKFLVPMILGKNFVILGKYTTILGKYCAIFSKIGKVNLLNWDFSAKWDCSRSIRNFFSQLGKNLVPETGPSFV